MASSDKTPTPNPASMPGDQPTLLGKPMTMGQHVLDKGAEMMQSLKPVNQMSKHVCTFALSIKDSILVIISSIWCASCTASTCTSSQGLLATRLACEDRNAWESRWRWRNGKGISSSTPSSTTPPTSPPGLTPSSLSSTPSPSCPSHPTSPTAPSSINPPLSPAKHGPTTPPSSPAEPLVLTLSFVWHGRSIYDTWFSCASNQPSHRNRFPYADDLPVDPHQYQHQHEQHHHPLCKLPMTKIAFWRCGLLEHSTIKPNMELGTLNQAYKQFLTDFKQMNLQRVRI